MSVPYSTRSPLVPPSLAERVDEVCDCFEAAWKLGQRPHLEDYLGDAPEPMRLILLRELVVVEIQYRRWCGELVALPEYQRRFPHHAEMLGALFGIEGAQTTTPSGEITSAHSRLGRYRLTGRIGSGSFGVVYQGHDDELRRDVAIKVPHRRHISSPGDIETYLAEARILAGLDHPGIVPVHDVGRTEDGLCYLVTKLAAGRDLRQLIQDARPSVAAAVEIVARIAEALHHAHQCGLVHRDIKPANILLDAEGNPLLTDFGLALREEDFAQGPTFAGSPAYMSPEQARGEGHLVDRRTDVFGLGVVFYELLTGDRPFSAASAAELLEQIKTAEPSPPSQGNDAIPSELDRICLKALAKRVSDRYGTALDLAEDLRRWQQQKLDKVAVKGQALVVPKGLRPFEAEDADFFLQLLPGPRDANGLPDSIRFWKTRIEAVDADKTFRVGLLYGPSGCGKSSLVKAGLLPRLSDTVVPVYVEATAAETEARLLKGLRRHCSSLPKDGHLVETLAALRRGGGRRGTRKVLLVLDQFEQWLHGRREETNTELVEALRQCDGQYVQCLVLVRDDFGMAATRFMSELEIPIVQGQNFATVDRFDLPHARKVLVEFGRAFGRLPTDKTNAHEQFLDQALAGLAQDGQIICVRLILFVEMVKLRPWTPATLKEVGGIEGLGVTFLEEMLGERAVNPAHRRHQQAAQAVLSALLPDQGSDIRGHMRSHQELLAASGLTQRPSAFGDLLRILDTDLRLIAPTDSEGAEEGAGVRGQESGVEGQESGVRGQESGVRGQDRVAASLNPDSCLLTSGTHYYQLTHDYLVPALRQWLTARQRETRRGRAELLLAERANVWNARPQKRHLPTWWEWATICLHSRPRDWTEPQRRMMRAAGRNRLLQAGVLALLLGVLGWAAVEGSRYLRAVELVRALDSVDMAGVSKIAQDLSSCRKWAEPRLRRMIEEGDHKQRLHASLALLPVDPGQVNYLYDKMLDADRQPDELWVLCQALREHQPEIAKRLSTFLEEEANSDRRLRAACALAFFDPLNPLWSDDTRLSDEVANKLLKEPPALADSWLVGSRAVRLQFGNSLRTIVSDPTRSESERTMAAHLSLLCKPIEVRTEEMAAFVLDTDDLLLYDRVLPYLLAKGDEAVGLMSEELDKRPSPEMSEVENDTLAKRQAKAAVFLLQYEQQEGPWPVQQADRLWPLLRGDADPRLRACLIHRFSRAGADPETLVRQYEDVEQDVAAQRALLLSLGGFKDSLPAGQRRRLAARLRLLESYRENPDPGVHAAVDWLLRSWGQSAELDAIDRELAGVPAGQRRWYVNGQGQTLTLLEGPVEFEMGSKAEEAGRQADESLHRTVIPRCFALGAKEVTALQFRAFLEAHPGPRHDWEASDRFSPDPGGPMIGVTWFQAVQYCRWLSEQEGIPEEQMCYPPLDQIKPGMEMRADYLSRTGYRLPTEAEWEYACRSHSVAPRHCGISEELLGNYAWYVPNANGRTHAVGNKMPNDYGLFDLYGNASEWCQDAAAPYPAGHDEQPVEDREDLREITNSGSRVLRGGSFASPALDLRSAQRFELEAAAARSLAGMRVARTYH